MKNISSQGTVNLLDIDIDNKLVFDNDIWTFCRKASNQVNVISTQLTFTSSISRIETLRKGVKYVQIEQQKCQNDVIGVVLVFLLLTWNIFHTFC